MRVVLRASTLVVILLLAACGRVGFGTVNQELDAATSDSGHDASAPGDGGSSDAGPGDAGSGDAGQGDAGSGDAGEADAGNDVTIIVTPPAAGTVTSDPPGIDCPGTCQLVQPAGQAIKLAAIERGNAIFSQWSGDCSGADPECNLAPTVDAAITAQFDLVNYVFVSDAQPNAAFGSRAAADGICQAEADAEGLPGTYLAWLSDSTSDAVDRFSGARGWVRIDGARVADTPADLAAGLIRVPIDVRADGQQLSAGSINVATGSNRDSRATGNDCSDYTDTGGTISTGNFGGVGLRWVLQVNTTCSNATRLYCFGTSNNVALPIRIPDPRRNVFITEDSWTDPSAGLADADAFCAAQAAEGGLPGTYVALLATDGVPAAGRVTDGANFTRTDGVPLAESALSFMAGSTRTSPVLNQFGNEVTSILPPITGAVSLDETTFSFGNCANWALNSESMDIGNQYRAYTFFGGTTGVGCASSTRPIFCIQQ